MSPAVKNGLLVQNMLIQLKTMKNILELSQKLNAVGKVAGTLDSHDLFEHSLGELISEIETDLKAREKLV